MLDGLFAGIWRRRVDYEQSGLDIRAKCSQRRVCTMRRGYEVTMTSVRPLHHFMHTFDFVYIVYASVGIQAFRPLHDRDLSSWESIFALRQPSQYIRTSSNIKPRWRVSTV